MMKKYNDLLERNVFINAEKITDSASSFLYEMKNYNEEAPKVVRELFVAEQLDEVYNEAFEFRLNELTHPNRRMGIDDVVKDLVRLEQGFISAILQRVAPVDGGAVADHAQRLLYGKNSMARQLLAIQSSGEEAEAFSQVPVKKTAPVNINAKFPKDQIKADHADSMIGFGAPNSSTQAYAQRFGALANKKKYSAGEYVFVSVNGKGRVGLEENLQRTKDEIDLAISQGIRGLLLDNETVANSSHNAVGEGEIRKYLLSKGLRYTMFKGVGLYQSAATPVLGKQHPLKDNFWIRNMIPVVQENPDETGLNDHIELWNKTMTSLDLAVLNEAFKEIVAYDGLRGTTIAKDLLRTAILQSGTINSPFSFLETLDGEMVAKTFEGIIGTYLNDPSTLGIPSTEKRPAFLRFLMALDNNYKSRRPYAGIKSKNKKKYIPLTVQKTKEGVWVLEYNIEVNGKIVSENATMPFTDSPSYLNLSPRQALSTDRNAEYENNDKSDIICP